MNNYQEWNRNRIKGIVDFYGHKFFYMKSVVDLGCLHADIGGALHRLGADVTAVDIRQEHLKIISKKFPSIKTIKADLDRGWVLGHKKVDIILDLDLLCHLMDVEKHLRDICNSATHIVLETAVCDSDDQYKIEKNITHKNSFDASANGVCCYPSQAFIERIFKETGFNFQRQDNSKYNTDNYVYDWISNNDGKYSVNNRRIWFAIKNNNHIKLANPTNVQITPPKINQPVIQQTFNTSVIQQTFENNMMTKTTNSNISSASVSQMSDRKKFVIVIPSYNNQKWCIQNITSALDQKYDNYRIIFTDDNSSDGTFEIVSETVKNSPKANKCTLFKNGSRCGALVNLYSMIHSCQDDEIIVTLDGDDWLSHTDVLNTLNYVYSREDIWISYGQYQSYPDNSIGISKPYSQHVINTNGFRQAVWSASHLRTFYAWLFKKIRKEDLFYNGTFLSMGWDLGTMLPMLELAGSHSKFISDILYIYNLENPLNDHKVNIHLQHRIAQHIRSSKKYTKLPDHDFSQYSKTYIPPSETKVDNRGSFITYRELGKNGRIGNQMFQVAALIDLAQTNKDTVKVNWFCNYTKKDMTQFFKHQLTRNPSYENITFTYGEPNFNFNPIPYQPNMNLHGYFQSEKYFESNKDVVRFYFEPADFILNKLNAKYAALLNSETCSIHVRRGDFVKNKIHEVCDMNYYNRAVSLINNKTKIDHFVVFSDDIEWCKRNFIKGNFVFIDGNLDIEDLFLMSLCKHHIISNSSFSWWGSWLNKNINKIIIAPNRWFSSQSNFVNNDIYTKEMILI